MRLALCVEYNGTNYFGWQKQNTHLDKTIQYFVDKAISKIADEEISTTCAGRTDTGVHAFGQIIHFDTEKKRSDYKWITGINSNMPNDIIIKSIFHTPDDFHSRYSAIDRSYRYIILNQKQQSVFVSSQSLHYPDYLDLQKIELASKHMLGEKDFSCFRSSGCTSKSPMKNIKSINITKNNNYIAIDITANSFMYHMVRNIIGELLLIGSGDKSPESINGLIASCDRSLCATMVPACGLYLMSISYPSKYEILTKQNFNIF